MEYLLLSVAALCASLQSTVNKKYNQKSCNRGTFLYAGLLSLFGMLFFLLSSSGLHFKAAYLPYSLLFALSYASANVGLVFALQYGPIALTALVNSFSLVIPTAYGLIFLQEKASPWLCCGLAFLAVSLFLIHFRRGEEHRFSPRWLVFATLAFVGSGMCSTSQKMQQVAFDGAGKNEFMVCALFLVALVLIPVGLLQSRRRALPACKIAWPYALICGLLNGMLNLLVMVLGGQIPTSLLFPLLSTGSMILQYLISRYYFQEKITAQQTAGIVVGIAAIVFFHL